MAQRQRLTTRRLVAAPDAFSGRNFNSPVMLYDTHPNKRFVVGEDVIPVSGGAIKGMPVRGQVIGHSAEDRLWVKWPTEIAQEDVSDVMALREYEYGGSTQARLKGPQASRAASREVQGSETDHSSDLVALKGPAAESLSHSEMNLLQEIEEHSHGVAKDQIADQSTLRSLFKKGFLELYPPNKIRSLGMATARRVSFLDHGDDETEEVQEVLFDSLPEDQDPEEDFDVEPEDSDEVTIIDMDSVCDDEFDQTSVIEKALQDSGLESDGSEMDDPFLTGSREAAFWDKPVYETKKLFDKTLRQPLKPGYHRFLFVVTQNQVAKVRAETPEDVVAMTKEKGYKVKSKVVERTLENGKLTEAQANALRKKNQGEGVNKKSYEITVQGPAKSVYIAARTEEEAQQSVASKGYTVVESRGTVDAQPGTMSETSGAVPKIKPAAIPGNPTGKPQYWGIKVVYQAPKQRTMEDIQSAPGPEDPLWHVASRASRRTGAGPGASSLSSFEVVKALTYEEAVKKIKTKAAEEGKKVVDIVGASVWDQKKNQWVDSGITIPTRQAPTRQAPAQQAPFQLTPLPQKQKAPFQLTPLDEQGQPAPAQQAPAQQGQFQLTPLQKNVASLEHHAGLIRDSLNMSRTADLVQQAARVAHAVQAAVETDDDLDDVVFTAVKQASQDILTATDQLRRTNHITAHRIASQIEQDFVGALSFRIGV